jgi:hypothetical protein
VTPNEALLVGAVLAQVALTLSVYVRLYRVRADAVRRGERRVSDWLVPQNEDTYIAKVSRSVSSQFELPVLFYVLALALLAFDAAQFLDAALAWCFVVSRIVHAWIHVASDDVIARARAFMAGFVIVFVMGIRLVTLVALESLGVA